jgi:hypothetical protein
MHPQNHESPSCENFGTPIWESWNKMPFGCGPRGECREYYKGEGGGFPHVRVVVSLVSTRFPMVHLSTKNVQTILTNMLFGLCRSTSEWISCLLFILVPSRSFNTPSIPEVLQAKECASTPCPFVIFILDFHLSLLRSLGVHQEISLYWLDPFYIYFHPLTGWYVPLIAKVTKLITS